MTGALFIIGLGPGAPELVTPEVSAALAAVDDVLGYFPYVERVPARPGLTRHGSDNGDELARARQGLALAAAGKRVALVSGGDAGVFGMAAAAFEVVEGEPGFAGLDIRVLPGISAMFAAAARVGAPLGHDFCAISLSDNLKPWDVIAARLAAAAEAGFVVALYNPISRARPWQLDAAFDLLRPLLPGDAPVVFARAVTRPDEAVAVVPLAEARGQMADMRTLVIIGTAETRQVARPAAPPFVYTPRRMA
ncbi:precorrin-3B C(17)-methyltransferase [Zavarzinia compransoris]|uniref:Precorrin-3B C(17)-methyltransferase n=1 Tax=Zavarzinia compransoris TaxID=1264899 RepID=A0A317DYT0_9PROT|nr:precorrin-3B C(17)-methyltransferase [Zavarzinia compransoris]PWR19611.1 precorrin-3B C(17)-methyltransferase [Zavarzinia compransoris]TDP40404.1 precorrin-3 methyltransferase [Zavarzinia compransoris]